jgi:ubiquinone/menaquinone biosynthesis C-methylase UbiE
VVDLVPDAAPSAGALSGDVKTSSRPAKKRGPFETEFGAFIYDKGYRQLFRALGYPGADAEAALALERLNGAALAPARGDSEASRVALDVSCGPGIITTRIAAGLRGYDALVASDVSEAMTKRAAEQLDTLAATTQVLRMKEGDSSSPAPLPAFAAVRADVSELPFADASVAAAHSSAGAHCWPDPERGFAEIARVLKPGGMLVASTVVLAAPIREKYAENKVAADAETYRNAVWDVNTPFWDADAVVEMVRNSGLVEVEVLREDKCFVMIAARKR